MEEFRYADAYAPPQAAPLPPSPPDLAQLAASQEVAQKSQSLRAGASWFLWVAVLSQLNSIFMLLNVNIAFCIGLGITPLVAGIAQAIENPNAVELSGAAKGAGFAVGLFGLLFFLVIYFFAQRGHRTAFILGMIVYLLDGLIFLLLGDFLSLAFHAFALYWMFVGLKAAFALKRAATAWAPQAAL